MGVTKFFEWIDRWPPWADLIFYGAVMVYVFYQLFFNGVVTWKINNKK